MRLLARRKVVEQLVDAHYADLYRFAFRLTASAMDAEDLTQETFCTAQRKMGQLRDPARVRGWLFKVLRNAYLHRRRAEAGRRALPLDALGELAGPLPQPVPEPDPEALQKALDELPEAFRTPLILFYFGDFSYRDIAEQMDVPLGTVMSRLARGKAHLRARLFAPEEVGTSAARGPGDGL